MNKKVTRRAVLGTTIAVLVAGPFVMRGLRNKRTVSLPYVDREETHSDIESEWNALRERFLHEWKGLCQPLEVIKYSGTKDRKIAINLAGLQTKKFTFVDTTVLGLVSSHEECTLENLAGYRVGNGVMQTHGEEDSLLLSTKDREFRYIKYSNDNRNFVAVAEKLPKADIALTHNQFGPGMAIVSVNGNSMRDVITHSEELLPLCSSLASVVSYPCAPSISVGSPFSVPAEIAYRSESFSRKTMPVEIVLWKDRQLLKLVDEQSFSCEEYQEHRKLLARNMIDYYETIIDDVRNSVEITEDRRSELIKSFENYALHVKKETEERVRKIAIEQETHFYKTTVYLDLVTGLAVWCETVVRPTDDKQKGTNTHLSLYYTT